MPRSVLVGGLSPSLPGAFDEREISELRPRTSAYMFERRADHPCVNLVVARESHVATSISRWSTQLIFHLSTPLGCDHRLQFTVPASWLVVTHTGVYCSDKAVSQKTKKNAVCGALNDICIVAGDPKRLKSHRRIHFLYPL